MTNAPEDAEATNASTNDDTGDTNDAEHGIERDTARASKGPQLARIVASVALLAVTAVGIGVASGWGASNESLSVAPPTAYESTASFSTSPATSATGTPSVTEASTPAGEATTAAPEPTETETPEPGGGLDITTASSITVLVNKRVSLDPVDFAPNDLVYMNEIEVPSINEHALRQDAALAVKDMFADATAAGHTLDMTSGYRDYDLQTILYNGYVEEQGQESADSTSARPGFSEHQTGLAADISAPSTDPFCILEECFGDTAAGQWLAENAWQYGFILRYPEGETAVTGYAYEPWHFRFIGVDAAAEYQASGATTYEEFLGLEPAPDYG